MFTNTVNLIVAHETYGPVHCFYGLISDVCPIPSALLSVPGWVDGSK